jgi:hypothetical protein
MVPLEESFELGEVTNSTAPEKLFRITCPEAWHRAELNSIYCRMQGR